MQGVKAKDVPENAAPHSTYFFQHNHSKRGIALDFKNERAREILKGMIAKADVLVENFSPGVMARAGMSFDDLKKLNPRLGDVLDFLRRPDRRSQRQAWLRLHGTGLRWRDRR